MQKFVVITGIRRFVLIEDNSKQAIESVKEHIRASVDKLTSREIGSSLAKALQQGRLNFLVFADDEEQPIAGEYRGEFHTPPRAELILHFERLLKPELLRKARAELATMN